MATCLVCLQNLRNGRAYSLLSVETDALKLSGGTSEEAGKAALGLG